MEDWPLRVALYNRSSLASLTKLCELLAEEKEKEVSFRITLPICITKTLVHINTNPGQKSGSTFIENHCIAQLFHIPTFSS